MSIQLPRWRSAATLEAARSWSDQFTGWIERVLAAGQTFGVNATPAGPAGGGLAGEYPNPQVPTLRAAALVTAPAGTTLAAAALAGGVILRSGPGAAFSDTTDTAAHILGAFATALQTVGQSFDCMVANTSGAAMTLEPGSGVTFAGNVSSGNFTIGAGATRLFRGIVTATLTPAVTIYA